MEMRGQPIAVGASKAAMYIMGSFDRRLRDPARLLVRFWGYLLWIFVFYLLVFDVSQNSVSLANAWPVTIWLVAYFGYLSALEISRAKWVQFYDTTQYRITRILINLGFITWLVFTFPASRQVLAFFYTIPIFASVVYFSSKNWVGIFVFILAAIGLYASGIYLTDPPLNGLQYLLILLGLFLLSYGLYLLYHKALSSSGQFSQIQVLLRTLDRQELVNHALHYAIQLTGATHSLVILFDPEREEYIAHAMKGFELQAGTSIENVAKECNVLASGEPFECQDMVMAFNDNTIYSKHFTCNPRSVLAEPLFNSDGRVVGVLNVAHDAPGQFERINKSQFHHFCGLVSASVANALSYRRARLNEIRSHKLDNRLLNSNIESDIMRIIFEDAHMLIPQADRYVIHRFMPKTEDLVAASMFCEGELEPWIWAPDDIAKDPVKMSYGVGIAGHSLALKESILVHDVCQHPWYIQTPDSDFIKSLLVAPLYDPSDDDLFGTISIFSSTPKTFTLDDEINLASLSYQGSMALARIKQFVAWKEQGGAMKRIFDEMRLLDVDVSEEVLCQKIASIATKILGFEIARIRLLEFNTNLLKTVAISGVPDKVADELLQDEVPVSVLDPFLIEEYRAERSYLIPNDDEDWQAVAKEFLYIPEQTLKKQTGWRAYDALLTPLMSQSGYMIGLLSLDLPREGTIPQPQVIEAIGVFSSTVAWTLELARTQRRLTEQQRRTWTFLGSLGPELARTRDFQSVGELVVQFGAKVLSAEGCSLYIVRQGHQEEIELTHSSYLAGTSFIGRKKPVTGYDKCGLTSWVAYTGKELCLNNGEHEFHPAWAGEVGHLEHLPSRRCHSLLVVPVKNLKGEVIAVISLENKRTSAGLKNFDEEDLARLSLLAKQFAHAWDVIGQYEIVQKWERKGIEDDLHDIINWYHSGVVLGIDALAEWMRRENYSKANEILPSLLRHSRTTINELKTVHTDLISNALEAETLKLSMKRMIDAWARRVTLKYDSRLQVILRCPDKVDVPVAIRNSLVRIASGAIANSILHSGIVERPNTHILVEIKEKGDWLRMNIVDNGIGMKKVNPGFGITRMHNLTNQLQKVGVQKAKFNIRSTPGEGTVVSVKLQIAPQIRDSLSKDLENVL